MHGRADGPRHGRGPAGAFEPPRPEIPAIGGFVETVWAPIRRTPSDDSARSRCRFSALVAGFRTAPKLRRETPPWRSRCSRRSASSNTDIATVTKLFGFWIALGGRVPHRQRHRSREIGMMASLLIGTVTASASHLALAYLARARRPWRGGRSGPSRLDRG
ncbi:hypothetical protein ACU4GR_12880 [Methylobacterium oryzae CBMB20]